MRIKRFGRMTRRRVQAALRLRLGRVAVSFRDAASREAAHGRVPGAAPGPGGIGGAQPRQRRAPHGPPDVMADYPTPVMDPPIEMPSEIIDLASGPFRAQFPELACAGDAREKLPTT
jgi:hypothetical protein